MTNNPLGLPLEYQKLPEYFDAHNINEETTAKNKIIEQLLTKHHVKTVLDLTCGTGSQVFYLHNHGYTVTGSDFSPSLIKRAKQKAQQQQKNITFLDGDMRNIQVGKFDAVITIFNAIGHLTKPDFEKALQNIYNNLNNKGIYIFDIFNLTAITNNTINDFKMDVKSVVNGVKIRHRQHSEIDRKNGLLTSHDHNTITKNNQPPEIITNTFSLQIYTAKELQQLLKQNGFETLEQTTFDNTTFDPKTSLNIVTVAKRT